MAAPTSTEVPVNQPPALIDLDAVSRTFVSDAETVWAVRDVALTLPTGTFAAVHGASGSGKSTLLNLIAGLDTATSGRIQVCGQDVGTLDEDRRSRLRLQQVGVVFQDHNLVEEFTAVENVMLPLEVLGRRLPDARREAAATLRRVGLDGLGDRFPAQLSGGQRQRVGVARALVGDRRILLADEPTGSLDSAASRALFALFRSLIQDGVTVVVATHDMSSLEFADQVFEMSDGRLASGVA